MDDVSIKLSHIIRDIKELNDKIQNLTDQIMKHNGSLKDSWEKSTEHGNKINNFITEVSKIRDEFNKLHELVYDTDNGFMVEIDRLKQHRENSKANVALWISIVMAIVTIISLIMQNR